MSTQTSVALQMLPSSLQGKGMMCLRTIRKSYGRGRSSSRRLAYLETIALYKGIPSFTLFNTIMLLYCPGENLVSVYEKLRELYVHLVEALRGKPEP